MRRESGVACTRIGGTGRRESCAASSSGLRMECALLAGVVLIAFVTARSPGQKPAPGQHGDLTIEAAEYLDESEREVQCGPESARSWAEKAIKLAGQISTRDPTVRATVAKLKTEGEAHATAAQARANRLSAAGVESKAQLKTARLETATTILTEADPQNCYRGFDELRSKITRAKEAAADAIRLGDATMWTNRKRALEEYRKAQKIDAEYPDLETKIDSVTKKRKAHR